ncbi:MAG: hypothetical protein ACFFCX_04810 [Candidatus Sifarchaeia archaeon]
MSPSKNEVSPFRPLVKKMDIDTMNVLMIVAVSVLVLMLVTPVSMYSEPTFISDIQVEETMSLSQDLLFYSLPDTNIRIATGEVSGYRGFAYVIEEESRLYFIDLVNSMTLDIALPAGVKANGAYLMGYDVDLDASDEFFIRNVVGGVNWYILMIDLNDGFVAEYPMPFIFPAPMGFGIFNGDAFPDLLVQNVNNRDNFLTLDVINNVTIGTFNADYAYVRPVIGHFTSASSDSIALVNQLGTTDQRNLTVVEPDGTLVQNILLTPSIYDMVTFDYLGGLEEIATIESDGDIVVYNGLTLTVEYTQNADPLSSTTRFIETGDFNADTQDDLVVISRTQEKAYYRDGTNGLPIRDVDGIWIHSTREFGVGQMDQDTTDELAIGTTYGGLGIFRGVDGDFAHLEYLLDVQSVAHQIIVYDYDGDSRDDAVVRIQDGVWILRSDTEQPIVTPLPINPVHPTVLDDFVTVKVDVYESSYIEIIDIWMRLPGNSFWMQPQDNMYASSTPGLYYAFIGNLQPGDYEYYIVVQDAYLNQGGLGNATHPEVFSVAGDFVWKIDKTETDFVHKSFHQSDLGNLSGGQPIIYTIERAKADLDLTLMKYSSGGGVIDSLTIANPAGIPFDNFALFTAMLDGDNIQDIIVLDLHYDKDYIFRYHVYHGSTFSLMDNGTIPFAYKSFNYIDVFDDYGDGNEELFIVSDTQPYNVIKMDSDLTWSAVNLPFSDDNRYSVSGFTVISDSPNGYIGVVRGDIQIDILTTDLVYSHSLDIDLSAYGNIDFGGIDNLYNATLGGEQFVASYTYWNGSDPTGRVYVFNSGTTNVNNTPVYKLDHQYITYFYPADATGDSIDDLFIKLPNELLLAELGSSLNVKWATPITGATPLSAMIANFDGDAYDEFLLFTDQDETLTQVNFRGRVEWIMVVGEVYNPLPLGDIDSIPGEEIAAFPFATVKNYSLGAIRNIDTHYIMDVTLEFTMTDVVQTEWFDMNVSVLNVYGEPIGDASVYMEVHYMTPEGPAVHTFSLYYNWMEQHYWGSTTASWPMGVANLSISINHYYYHHYGELFVDAMTVRSHLYVTIASPPYVNQGDSMNVSASVTDIMGRLIRDASVNVYLAGVPQVATLIGPEYVASYSEVQLGPGSHEVEAQATHPFGTGLAADAKWINVRLLASTLNVNTDFPSLIQQDELVTAWFNITDQYGVPVPGAYVSLVSGPVGFELIDGSDPGSYIFNHLAQIGIGNHTFELRIERQNIVGLVIQEISFDVYGNLTPNIFYESRVAGGSDFEVTVFVRDKYGPVFLGTSVEIDINGTIYTASHGPSGNPEYIMLVTADFLLGLNNFTVSVDATYADAVWTGILSIHSFSDAATDAELFSSEGWVISQGVQTEFQLHFVDWAERPVSGATVTVFVNALSYKLLEGDPGVYVASISTIGWLPGDYEYVVSVVHLDVETGDPLNGTLRVMGTPEFFVTYSPETPIQGQPMVVNITIVDGYGNPIPDLEVYIEMMGLPPMQAYAIDQVGAYVAEIPAVPTTEGYGDFTLAVTAIGEFIGETLDVSNTVTIAPATPNFAMSTNTLSIGAGASFVLSLIGMVIYFRIASSMRVEDKSLEGRKKSVRNMDRLYLLIVLGSGAGLVASYSTYTAGNYSVALILTVALLGCSVLLYGLWLYRDATAAVLVRGSLSKRRMVLGLWHLVFVPVVIFLILLYGVEIDWFKAYIIDSTLTIGTIAIPSIMTTIFVAYVSSILVVVVNLYREVSKGLKKIVKMEDAGTPLSIVEDEKTSMVSRFSSSVRIKFLMFLVVVGATTVMSMDFLASWELGVIVLLPMAFLVVIPFISSKIIQVFSKISKGRVPSAPTDV